MIEIRKNDLIEIKMIGIPYKDRANRKCIQLLQTIATNDLPLIPIKIIGMVHSYYKPTVKIMLNNKNHMLIFNRNITRVLETNRDSKKPIIETGDIVYKIVPNYDITSIISNKFKVLAKTFEYTFDKYDYESTSYQLEKIGIDTNTNTPKIQFSLDYSLILCQKASNKEITTKTKNKVEGIFNL